MASAGAGAAAAREWGGGSDIHVGYQLGYSQGSTTGFVIGWAVAVGVRTTAATGDHDNSDDGDDGGGDGDDGDDGVLGDGRQL